MVRAMQAQCQNACVLAILKVCTSCWTNIKGLTQVAPHHWGMQLQIECYYRMQSSTEESDDNAVLTIFITLTRLYDAQEKL